MPPENDLMRGERQLSEHELRFQRSLRNLNTPEWYKKSSTKPETTLRRDYGSGSLAGGWSGFNSKSTSKESLQSSRCTTPTTQSKVVIPSRGSASELGGRAGSPRRRRSPARGSRSTSPSRRPVWLETAFVGTKPMDEPPTPEAAGAVLSDPLAAGGGGSGGGGGGSAASSPATAS
ncbi:hypothetical protein FJT64_001317 [Amphibalanus amphitrite]|uniref:Uncharacterized protein n=1 Tax=Amphibalanus amphitrite TaxID=1232801 RepID=A0A6A4VDG3_AMPAM|nr:hypothetical protein FJT64_001317 [Amphibalanus amphitrite]